MAAFFTYQRTNSSSSLSGWKRGGKVFFGYVPSVYGGAGGYGTRISRSNLVLSSGSPTSCEKTSVIHNEKGTMQNLNDRLANYLEKVESLEAKNRQLEQNIAEFNEKKTAVSENYDGYYSTIEDLHAQIVKKITENQAIQLQLDNADLAVDDFKMKYELEINLHLMVEDDMSSLREIRDSLTLSISDLELTMEDRKKQRIQIKETHKEEKSRLSIQCSGAINVEVDSAFSVDLKKVLQEMRERYETLVRNNNLEIEKWFQAKVKMLQKQIVVHQTDVKTFHKELSDLKKTYQSLMISRQSTHTEIMCLQENLKEVKSQYSLQRQQLQVPIPTLESELHDLKVSLLQVQTEYNELLDIKMRLEAEIAEYKRLLGQEESEEKKKEGGSKENEEEVRKPRIEKRVKRIIEKLVDGVVVSVEVQDETDIVPEVLRLTQRHNLSHVLLSPENPSKQATLV